jgi:hypothetical protein
MARPRRYPKCFDPYLRYAISTSFTNFEFVDENGNSEFFDEKKGFTLFLIVEFKSVGQANNFVAAMNAALANTVSIELGPADDNAPYATMRAPTLAVSAAVQPSAVFYAWEQYVSRVELSLPLRVAPPKRKAQMQIKPIQRWKEGKTPPGEMLIGILDDGCPFAASQFLRAWNPASTRVRAIWDQDQITSYAFGQPLPDFKYGWEFRRDYRTPGGVPLGLDDWIRLHLTPTGSVDEDGCYEDAKFRRLALRESHGAHVMDVLAGRVPPSSRVSPLVVVSNIGELKPDPANWKPGSDRASQADIVFVQFPYDCIRDATGVWLKGYVLDGVRYILTFADPKKTERVIVNLSYGPTTGPHDGTAVLEEALGALVQEFDGKKRKPKLEVILAAGNSYLTDGHVAFIREKGKPDYVEWSWRLLPDNPVLCFAEVWMDKTQAGRVMVTLTSPSGTITVARGPIEWGRDCVWLLEVGLTMVGRQITPSEHGDYTIKVAGLRQGAHVHAYIARSDPNMGVFTNAKRSYFVDPRWEETRSAAANCTYINGEFDDQGSLVSRYGTLNGIATGDIARVHVAGGDVLANGFRAAPYSSAGPARTGRRIGPDYALFCDESCSLQGVRGGGTRSGSVFRLIGTSAAAPQLARHIANNDTLVVYDRPTTPDDTKRRGRGDIAPP